MSKTIAAMQDRSRDNDRRESQLVSTRDETVVAIGESETYRAKLLVRAARAVEMRDYVTDVLDCLAAKEAELVALEERAVGALEARRVARPKSRAPWTRSTSGARSIAIRRRTTLALSMTMTAATWTVRWRNDRGVARRVRRAPPRAQCGRRRSRRRRQRRCSDARHSRRRADASCDAV
jgi:hypothetical protein